MGRIFPWTIYGAYVRDEERMTMEEIAADYDIPLEAVQEAIEYYESNPPEMLEDFRREDALMEAAGMNDPNYKYHPSPRILTAEEISSDQSRMRLYLDDDSTARRLIVTLQKAGHDVQIPQDVGRSGDDDSVHLLHAVEADRVMFTGNHRDFENLHNLIKRTGGNHPGIIVMRKDADSRRKMRPEQIVQAIAKLSTTSEYRGQSVHRPESLALATLA